MEERTMETVHTTPQAAQGCMTCKGQHPYTVEEDPNGNTGWRCQDCGDLLRLLPGRYVPQED